jgi:hypothetical protein
VWRLKFETLFSEGRNSSMTKEDDVKPFDSLVGKSGTTLGDKRHGPWGPDT